MSTPEQSQEEAVKAVYSHAANLIKSGKSPSQVESDLMANGLSREAASVVVGKLTQALSQAKKKAGGKNMLIGGLFFIGGIMVTLYTYSASSGGGTYVITWGAIIFGAIQFIRGLLQYYS